MKQIIAILFVMVVASNTTFAQWTVTQNTPLAVTLQPSAPAPTCEGNGIQILSTTVTGTLPMYQWQRSINAGTTWNNVIDGGVFSGANTASLTLTNAPIGYNNDQYRCVISSQKACLAAITSDVVTITILANPAITLQPVATIACSGTPTSFSVTATGAGLTYQWRRNGVNLANVAPYSNVTTATMNISDVTGLGGSTFDVVITGTCGIPITSNSVTLTENALVAIITQPIAPVAVCAGVANQTMTVAATGTGLTYQWREDGGNITNDASHSGATTATLTLINPTTSHSYDVVITGTCSAVTSIAVNNPVSPQATIVTPPTAQSVCASGSLYSNTCTFSVVDAGAATYQWQYNSGSGWNNATGAPYSGENTASLLVTDPAVGLTGTQYRVHLTTGAGCSATYTPAVAMTVNPLPNNVTVLVDGVNNLNPDYCVGGVTFSMAPTQSAIYTYELQLFPSGIPVASVNGNDGTRTITGITTSVVQLEIRNTVTGCGFIKLNNN